MKNKNKIYWVWLSLICRPGSRTAVRLLRHFEDAGSVYKATAAELLESGAVRESEPVFSDILRHDTSDAEDIVKWCADNGVDIITPDSDNYPSNLYSLRDAPVVLYCAGELPDFDKYCSIAVVGSRNMSEYGRANSFRFGYGLAKAGAVVVSGLALGVDGMAMASAVVGGGITVGVLGCGIDVVYPKEHRDLFRSVIKTGAIITEYPPASRPQRGNFPQRNRIISGLAQGTLVVEAAEGSGSLITARHSVYQGRDLFSVPGGVDSKYSEGTNHLIKEGAYAVTGPSDIIERYEFIYPHTLDLSSMKRATSGVDIARSAEKTMIAFGVRTEGDRKNVYGRRSSLCDLDSSPVVMIGEDLPLYDEDPFEPDGTVGRKPDALPARDKKSAAKKKKFPDAPSEPKRMDFELLSENDLRVYNAMTPDTPMIPEELLLDGMRISDVMASLTMLEISGAVEAGAGGYFMRSSADDALLPEKED